MDADWMLLAGDETALPAISRCLEMLPETTPALVVIEVADPEEVQELRCGPDVDVAWYFRSEAGGRSRLAEAVMQLAWLPGDPYLWVAGETMVVKPLRRWAKRDRQLPKECVDISGYWRAPTATTGSDAAGHEVVRTDDVALFESVERHSDFLPAFAIRAAVSLGVFFEIDHGAVGAKSIAEACRAHAGATTKLLRMLESLDLVGCRGETYFLTETGKLLADPDAPWIEPYSMESIETRMRLGFVHLDTVVRTGSPVGIDGLEFADWMADSDRADDLHGELIEWPAYLAPAFPGAVSLDGVDTIAVVGEAGGVYLDALLRVSQEDRRYSVAGLPSVTARMLDDVGPARRGRVHRAEGSTLAGPSEPVDVLIAAGVLETLPDIDATDVLAQYIRAAERVVVPYRLRDPAVRSEQVLDEDLTNLCVFGSGFRTETEFRALVGAAGARILRVGQLGWGASVIEIAADVN